MDAESPPAVDWLNDPTTWIVVLVVAVAAAISFMAVRFFRSQAEINRRLERRAGSASQADLRKTVVSALVTIGSKVEAEPESDVRLLRSKLIQAGIFWPEAVVAFVAVRIVFGLAFAAASGGLALSQDAAMEVLAGATLAARTLGYLAAGFALDRLIGSRRAQHRDGFPDVMDLMLVCSQAGLSIEAAINRIAHEIAVVYPSLSLHLDIAARELRGGKPLADAIESLAHQLGIEEARSFSTLLQQSKDLGASLSQSLRAYADDMRNKRIMHAEEKAYALPAKLVIPLTLFIFPTIFVVILLPTVVSVQQAFA